MFIWENHRTPDDYYREVLRTLGSTLRPSTTIPPSLQQCYQGLIERASKMQNKLNGGRDEWVLHSCCFVGVTLSSYSFFETQRHVKCSEDKATEASVRMVGMFTEEEEGQY